MDEDLPAWNKLVEMVAQRVKTPGHATTIGGAMGSVNIAYPPVAENDYEEQERRLGIRLPTLLKRLCTEVGNGGYGPGHGLLTMIPLSPADHGIQYCHTNFRNARNLNGAEWPAGVVAFNNWGCLIYSCVDITTGSTDPPVLRFEPNMGKEETFNFLKGTAFRGTGMIPERDKLSEWVEDWVDGREMFSKPYGMDK